MTVAVLSGKGGAGKTFVAANLKAVEPDALYVDADVEEPDGNLFFKDDISREDICSVMVPVFDENKCTGCRECVDHCAFHALAFISHKPIVFEEVCHSCGLCRLVCKAYAVTEGERRIGRIAVGKKTVSGILDPGIASAVPLIENTLKVARSFSAKDYVVDCPPGTSCSVIASVKDADYAVVVVEPTEFGKHNFCMVDSLLRTLGKRYGVVVNKDMGNDAGLDAVFSELGIEPLLRIPFSRSTAFCAGSGLLAVEHDESFRNSFASLWESIRKEAAS